MRQRPLSADDAALWARVTATVRALAGRGGAAAVAAEPSVAMPSLPPTRVAAPSAAPMRSAARPGETLDGGWDRRLRQGSTAPDRTIDLHGHTLASAHLALDGALDRAIQSDARLLLVVTGKPPRTREAGGDPLPRRGLIRATIGDWLATSRHAGHIAAVRNAHPRHGGAGALYVVLRRRRA